MAQHYSPRIVQDSLVMCLDASQNKSYPTTDLPVKSGLVMWMDAADDTTFSYSSGTTVSQWRDKSGFNYHMVPVSAGPTRNSSLASRKVLLFTTSQQIWNSSINLVTSAYTIFCVTRLTGNTNSRVLSTQYVPSTGGNWLLGHWGGYVNQYYAEGWVSGPYGTAANTAWNVFMGDWSGNSTDLSNLYTNGTAITTNSNGANAGPIGLGVNINSEVSTCEAAEIVVFNRVLSATERRLVDTYLGQKWGILNTDRNIFDLSGYEDNGFLGDGTTANMPLLDYYNNGSLRFDGTNDYLSVTRTLSVPFTISGFIKYVDQNKSYNTFMNGRPHTTLAISLNRNGAGNLQIFIGNGSSWLGAPAISYSSLTVDTWYNITFTCDGTTSRLYLNGVSIGTSALIPSGFGSYFYLGHLTDNASSSEYLKGNIAAAQLYTTALSAAEVLQNYEAQKSKFANSIVQQGLVLNIDINNPYSYGGSGTTIYDVSPTALSWTGSNVTYNSDSIKYFSYNGSNSWLESSTSNAFDTQTLTMECWCYPNSLSQNGFLFEKGQVNTQYSMFFAADPLFIFRTISLSTQDLTFTPSTHLTVNAWNHIVCTYASGTKTIYVNGIQRVQQTGLTGTIPTGQTNQYIGKYGNAANNYPFNGRIGESRVYNIALSAAQVLQNYNATKGRFGL
jgi:hypothetical protein